LSKRRISSSAASQNEGHEKGNAFHVFAATAKTRTVHASFQAKTGDSSDGRLSKTRQVIAVSAAEKKASVVVNGCTLIRSATRNWKESRAIRRIRIWPPEVFSSWG